MDNLGTAKAQVKSSTSRFIHELLGMKLIFKLLCSPTSC